MLSMKSGVKISQLKPQIVLALIVAHEVYDRHHFELVITSGEDSKHKRGTKHLAGEAVDLRTNNLPNKEVAKAIRDEIAKMLGENYDVLFEDDLFDEFGKQIRWQHIHIEYDPKEVI